MRGRSARMRSAISVMRWWMSNSRRRARGWRSPRLAMRYRRPKAQCGYLALSVVRTMSGMAANPATITEPPPGSERRVVGGRGTGRVEKTSGRLSRPRRPPACHGAGRVSVCWPDLLPCVRASSCCVLAPTNQIPLELRLERDQPGNRLHEQNRDQKPQPDAEPHKSRDVERCLHLVTSEAT